MSDAEAGLPREEISPFLVCRTDEGTMECAIWKLSEGEKALALFMTEESAGSYTNQTSLGREWKIYQPSRADLLEIIKQSKSSGVTLAVLDPDDKQGKRLFDLREVETE